MNPVRVRSKIPPNHLGVAVVKSSKLQALPGEMGVDLCVTKLRRMTSQ